MAEEAVAIYQENVLVAARYLGDRGLQEGTARSFRLGVVVDPMPGHERFRGMLSIPYLAGRDAHPVTMRFRCMQDHDHQYHGKYNSIAGDRTRPFNSAVIHAADNELHITEGEFDAMVLNQIGLPAIAIPGASLWQPHYPRMLAGFQRVWVWGDPDEAGAELVNTVTRAVRQARPVRLSMDVNDTYINHGEDALRDLVAERQT